MADRALDIMMRVLDLPETEQRAAIDEACGGDVTLRREVLELLAADATAGGFLESGIGLTQSGGAVEIPDMIGGYRVTDRIGEGGFGIVYRAEQSEPVRRTVAIKVIKPGMDSGAVLRRFALERRSLGMMNHPNLARVLDAGVIPDGQKVAGRPYFVMELVEGEPITAYARRRGLSVDERVRLLLQVCAATQHAHSKGVIHRDLKPSNILVSEVDGRPVCKVIDFGVVKVLDDSDQAGVTLFTSPGAMVGTPQYMSPEQMRGSADIDTRSDVYALGAVLYELLAGSPPFDAASWHGRDLKEMLRLVEEEEPGTPSLRAATRVARESGPDGLTHEGIETIGRVPRDLDWVTLRAMAKEPDRRYPTAAAMGDDLRRYLADEPVEAGPPSVSYRFSKFVRRNRAGVIAAAVAGVGVLGGAGVSVWFGLAAERARSDEQTQRESAERNQRRYQGVNEFLVEDLFFSAAPENLGPQATLVDLLDRAAPTIGERFGDDTDMLARMHYLMGSMYHVIMDLDDAKVHFDASLALLPEIEDPELVEIWRVYVGRGHMHRINGQLDEAQVDFESALPFAERIDEHAVRSVRTGLASTLASKGDFDRAEIELNSVLEGMRAAGLERDISYFKTLTTKMNVLGRMGRFEEALETAEELIRLGSEAEGRTSRTAVVTASLWRVTLLARLGRAEDAAEAAIAINDEVAEVFGPNSEGYAAAKANTAQVLWRADRPEEAERFMLEAIADYRRIFGDHHYHVERLTNDLAVQYGRAGMEEKSAAARERGLLLRLYVAGPGEDESVRGVMDEGAALLGSMDAWARMVREEFRALPPEHEKRARYYANAAIALEGSATGDELERWFQIAYEAMPDAERPEDIRRILMGLVPGWYERAGRAEEAARWSRLLTEPAA